MLLYAIRHGESWSNAHGVYPQIDTNPLTEKGIEDARRTGNYIKNVKFDVIYSSALIRAQQTAQIAIPGCNPVIDKRLNECDYGSLALKCQRECLETMGPEFRKNRDERNYAPYGGESTHQQIERVKEFMKSIESLDSNYKVAVFCHEGSIKSMLSVTLEVEFLFSHTGLPNGSVSIFEFKNGCWKIKKWGLTGNDL